MPNKLIAFILKEKLDGDCCVGRNAVRAVYLKIRISMIMLIAALFGPIIYKKVDIAACLVFLCLLKVFFCFKKIMFFIINLAKSFGDGDRMCYGLIWQANV